MKFMRREDLSPLTRCWLALEMVFPSWGKITSLSRQFGVSRQFLYDNAKRLATAFEADHDKAASDRHLKMSLHHLILCLWLHGNSSIEGMVRTFDEMGWTPGSAGHISEFLQTTAKSCQIEVPQTKEPVVLLLDETFTGQRPILVIMDASSHCILDILFASDRKASTWEALLKKLEGNGLEIKLLVKDQGSSLKAAAKNLGYEERADLFHLLKPFDPYLPSLESHAYGTIAQEYERARIFDNRKSEASLLKSLDQYEKACTEAEKAARESDDYDCLHLWLHEAFNNFTDQGDLRTRSVAQGDIEAILTLMEEEFLTHKGICSAVKFLRKNLPDYWSYFEQLEDIIATHKTSIPPYILRAVCQAWQLKRKAMAVKSSTLKKILLRRGEELSSYALTGADDDLKTAVESLYDDLESNIRSSSPLEAINSVIRRKLNACRGQITQDLLTMLACFLNHRKATRGKYAGTSPWERMSGIDEQGSSTEQILRMNSDFDVEGWQVPDKDFSVLPLRKTA